MIEINSKDVPLKFVWRRQKWYRNGKIAYKACPVCLNPISRSFTRCDKCNQLLDWEEYDTEREKIAKNRLEKEIAEAKRMRAEKRRSKSK